MFLNRLSQMSIVDENELHKLNALHNFTPVGQNHGKESLSTKYFLPNSPWITEDTLA